MDKTETLDLARRMTDWLQGQCARPDEAIGVLAVAISQLMASQAPTPEAFAGGLDEVVANIKANALSLRRILEQRLGETT